MVFNSHTEGASIKLGPRKDRKEQGSRMEAGNFQLQANRNSPELQRYVPLEKWRIEEIVRFEENKHRGKLTRDKVTNIL